MRRNGTLSFFMTLWLLVSTTAFALTCPPQIATEKSLLIRALSVVEDPVRTAWTGSTATTSDGAWSFGRLMTNMAGPHHPSDFVRQWLRQWEVERRVNTLTVEARPSIKSFVIDPWPKHPDGRLDLTRAPMRLLAIVFRPDLRDLAHGKAGEGRFVFGVLDADGHSTEFTVILEYVLPATTAAEVLDWAEALHELSTLAFGKRFNRKLEGITNRFAGPGVVPTRLNGSAISQVRTNEIALAFPWELREFRLHRGSHLLKEVTVKQTPASDLNHTAILADWIRANTPAILASPGRGSRAVPVRFQGTPFRAGAISNNIDVWDTPATNRKAMFRVALNTCNGCHGAETNTGFLHIHPREKGARTVLSGFLTGTTVGDPRDGTSTRRFHELAFRQADLAAMLCPSAAQAAAFVAADETSDALGRPITGDLTRGPSVHLTH
jgi:hypothetical protein